MITLIAQIEAKPGKETQLLEELKKLSTDTNNEEGCIHYILHQEKEDPVKFMFYEQFKDQTAFKAHGDSEHIKAFAIKNGDLLAKPTKLTFLETIS